MKADQHVRVIETGKPDEHYWRSMWDYRELFHILALRDITVRYKQTALGIVWSVIRPIVSMIVFTILFGNLAKFPSDGVPYPLLVFAGLLPWQLFTAALTQSGGSIVRGGRLVTKTYFPRLILPTSATIVSLIDFLIAALVLIALMFWYQYVPSWRIVVLPFLVFLTLATALGPALLISAIHTKYRDAMILLPYLLQIGTFLTPVGYSASVIPDTYQVIYSLNPMAGVIGGFRWALLGTDPNLYWPSVACSLGLVILLFSFGLRYFKKAEGTFVDVM